MNTSNGSKIKIVKYLISALVLVGISMLVIMLINKNNELSDIKNNINLKVAEGIKPIEAKLEDKYQKELEEKEKQPLDIYTGQAEFGTFSIKTPKTWSRYIAENISSVPLEFTAHPNYVPVKTQNTKYALRATIKNESYTKALEFYNQRLKNKDNKLTITPVTINGVDGVTIQGLIENQIDGTMVVFPLRDKVVRVWTESVDFQNDFNNIILPSISFIP
jgi:hypothetical protein